MPQCYYAYAVTEGEPPLETAPLAGEAGMGVITVSHLDLTLVASPVEKRVVAPTPSAARTHNRVISLIMAGRPVIPFSFGTVFGDQDEARELLKSAYPEIKRLLVKFRGRIELGLKVIWKKEALAAELEKREELRRLKEEVRRLPPGQAYPAALRLGRQVEGVVLQLRSDYTGEICAALEALAVESRYNQPLNERMVCNAAFLLDKELEPQFDAEVNRLYEAYGERFDFRYSGPWPPYNFVDLRPG